MSVLSSSNSHHQSSIICFLLLSLFTTSFLFHVTLEVYATPISFNFSGFDSNHPEIFTERDACVSIEGIDLTTNTRGTDQGKRVGRATYTNPLHLWDKVSGNLTNFTTHFSFIINSNGESNYGDGLTFFLALNGSRVPQNMEAGGGLGLAINDNVSHALNYAENQFVAIEFDTYKNPWDPLNDHVGINIRSMKSVEHVSWLSEVRQGITTDAWIRYDSSQKVLSVKFAHIDRYSNSIVEGKVSAVVDLAKHLPEWVTFGFSASTGLSKEMNRITSWEFNSSSDIVELNTTQSDPAGTANITPAANTGLLSKKSKSKIIGLVAGLSVGACVSIVGAGFASYLLRRKKQLKTDDPVFDFAFSDDFKNGTGPRKLSYNELADATDNFSEVKKLGEGGFGAVYRGFLKEINSYVAVKRVSKESKQGIKEYAAEVKIISRMRHRNLVKLMGWCHERELLLAYEFMPGGSLDAHLFKGKSLLKWEVRYKIAQGLASALLYLHEESDQCVLHRDIKSSNIMLDSSFDAKLGDFGLARLVDHAKGSQTTVLAGTMGYMAPECFTTGKASKESDIYSFGVVALEMACGRRVLEPGIEENQTRLMEWVWELYGIGKLLQAADPKLSGDFNEQEMERLMIVGLCCAHPDHAFRPSIRQVINLLISSEVPLPVLPPEMPVPAYLAPPVKLSMSSSYSSASSIRSIHNSSMRLIH
ncbi:L-type lectin-domain containing receptor kinase IX.1 [Ricinus communis]|uniref:Kinase, putative n=1 Tax=Ricinus communis TaxID=3988 RepID=B9RX63_RICCO|nr:L-type lectin-domain containing receptor kinase IX.1 [Ricinus communis]EEF44092.1 kinase, putative [Ricinus communis]